MQSLEKILKYTFKNNSWMQKALIHSSKGGKEFQRLEFLGDRIINLCLTVILFETHVQQTEGYLAKQLAQLASAKTLKKIALSWHLDQFILCTSTQTDAILSDACEALVGAIFLDSGKNLELCLEFIRFFWQQELSFTQPADSKTALQEKAYALFKLSPVYETTLHKGKDHNPVFKSIVMVGPIKANGFGSSRKEAEKAAAEQILKHFNATVDQG